MKFKVLFVALFGLVLVFMGCSDNVVADFTYSPAMPKCGQKVTFTNISTGDEEWEGKYWNWNFGDDTKTSIKSPTHIYQKPGIYNVTLQVDSNKRYVKTLSITVYDSIPTIYINTDSVKYFQEANFSVLVYNPKNLKVTYQWTFSANAKSKSLINDTTSAASLIVYFDKKNVEEQVTVRVKIENESEQIITRKFFVHDIKSRSLLMAQKSGKILRQRIFLKGTEDYMTTQINSGKHPFNIYVANNKLYVFDAGTKTGLHENWQTDTSGDGSIKQIDLGSEQQTEIIHNTGMSSRFGFANGFIDRENIYWTDWSDFLYRTPINSTIGKLTWKGNYDDQTTVPYYLAKTDRLGYYGNGMSLGQQSGGVYFYDQVYFWAKGGLGKGIYKFLATDILTSNSTGTAPIPTLGAILTDYAIRAFAIDKVNQKIYFSVTAPADRIGFWVANLNGSGAKRIDDAPIDNDNMYITGIVIDNESNKVYWAYRSPETIGASSPSGSWENYYSNHPTHRTGIKQASLATNFKPAGEISYFVLGVSAYGIALDEVRK